MQNCCSKRFLTTKIYCLQAPISFKLSQASGRPGYKVTVRNKHWFTSTAGLTFSSRLMLDGEPVAEGLEGDGWTTFDLAEILPQVTAFVLLTTIRHLTASIHELN